MIDTIQAREYVSWAAFNTNFEIRRALHIDVEAIVNLVNEAYSEKDHGYYRLNDGKEAGSRTHPADVIKKIENKHKISIFVCVKKADSLNPADQIVGTLYLKHHRKIATDKGNVCMFAVDGNYRRKYQVGSHLLQTVEYEARKHQIRTLSLDVVDAIGEHNQEHLIRYYFKNGFSLTGEKVTLMYHTFKQEITLLKMEKKL